jgi:hypothetical protein
VELQTGTARVSTGAGALKNVPYNFTRCDIAD